MGGDCGSSAGLRAVLSNAPPLASFFVGGADIFEAGSDHCPLQHQKKSSAIAPSDDGLIVVQ